MTSKPYISNRPLANDVAGDGWGISFYDYYPLALHQVNSNTGPFPEFMKAENDLLAAEGYIRTGNIAEAAAKIDLTRVAIGGLPALSGVVTSATQAVPGGANCVPQVPTGTGTVACGNILEAMKYEKRIENDVLGLRPVLDRRPRLGRSRRRHAARVPGSVSRDAVEAAAVLPAGPRIRQRGGQGSLRILRTLLRRRWMVSSVAPLLFLTQACYQYVPIETPEAPVGNLLSSE